MRQSVMSTLRQGNAPRLDKLLFSVILVLRPGCAEIIALLAYMANAICVVAHIGRRSALIEPALFSLKSMVGKLLYLFFNTLTLIFFMRCIY